MLPSEMVPDFLFDEPNLVLAYTFCLHKIAGNHTRVLHNREVVQLKKNEVLIPIGPLDPRLNMDPDLFEKQLGRMEELDLINFARKEKYFLVQFTKLQLNSPIETTLHDISNNALTPITVDAFAERYLEYVRENLAARSLDNADRVMKHFRSQFGRFLLEKLEPYHLEHYKEIRRKADWHGKLISPSTVNMDIRSLKAAMQQAIAWGYLRENPFRAIKQIRQDKQHTPAMDIADLQPLLEATEDERLKPLFEFAYLTGFRRGEIIHLQWKDMDLDRGLLTAQSSEDYRVKHGKSRTIPLSPPVKSLIEKLERLDLYVFTDKKGERFHEDYVTKSFKRAARNAGLNESLKFHSLRATFASTLAENNVPLHKIQRLLGHSSIKTTEGYTQIPADGLREAVETLTMPSGSSETTGNRIVMPVGEEVAP